jgi:hypothetical protein
MPRSPSLGEATDTSCRDNATDDHRGLRLQVTEAFFERQHSPANLDLVKIAFAGDVLNVGLEGFPGGLVVGCGFLPVQKFLSKKRAT